MIGLDLNAADAVVIFGSAVRTDFDALSDRDVLVVGGRHDAELVELQNRLTVSGWSVASFSWGQLDKLVRRQSLFLTHIAIEGVIIHDRDHRFKHLMSQFAPASNYDDEIEVSKQMLAVVQQIPCSPSGRLWASDVMAVAFRNLAISVLANRGIYKFSMRDIASSLYEIGVLSKEDCLTVERLRKLKFCHRRHLHLPQLDIRVLHDAARIIDRVLGLDWQIKEISVERSFEDGATNFAHPYALSRAIEKVVLLARPTQFADCEEFESQLNELAKWVSEPRKYVWMFKDAHKAVVERHLKRLVCMSVPELS